MKLRGPEAVGLLVVLGIAGSLAWAVYERLPQRAAGERNRATTRAVPVEVGAVRRGAMQLKRTFSGAIEARAQFVVAPKVSGRIERLYVNLADTVTRGQVVAELDNDEYRQAVVRGRADVEVARANLAAAESALVIADRELTRIKQLLDRGIAADTQFDVAKANQLSKRAELEVAGATLRKAEAVLETSKIQLGYTRVTADWVGGREERIVAERFVNEGGTVAANASLLRIVELNPVNAVIFVTEKDYVNLVVGHLATLTTDAYPGELFEAHIERIAPVFREATRQARVELSVDNPELRLKPGMFVRATAVMQRLENAVSVPEVALTARGGKYGVFEIAEDGVKVHWRVVEVGIRDGDRVQVHGAALDGRVVILGQQFLDDGSAITIVE